MAQEKPVVKDNRPSDRKIVGMSNSKAVPACAREQRPTFGIRLRFCGLSIRQPTLNLFADSFPFDA